MDAAAIQQQAVYAEWIVVEEEEWLGVNECGAIFAPDREMRFEVNEDDWAIGNDSQIQRQTRGKA